MRDEQVTGISGGANQRQGSYASNDTVAGSLLASVDEQERPGPAQSHHRLAKLRRAIGLLASKSQSTPGSRASCSRSMEEA